MVSLADFKVFIVDDDNYCRELLYSILLSQGFTNIQQFDNGVDCLKNLSHQPDFVFLDYNMDPINGLELLTTAKRLCPDAIFMMVSAQEDLQVAFDAINAGATDYIIKDRNVGENICSTLNNVTAIRAKAINKINKIMKPSQTMPSSKSEMQRVNKMRLLMDNFKKHTSVRAENFLSILLILVALLFCK